MTKTLAAFILGLFLLTAAAAQTPPAADLLLVNGNFITMNPRQPSVEAVAVRGDRVVWAGTASEAQRRFAGAGRTVDLQGATVLPGLLDAHTHLLSLGESLLRLNLKGVRTPEEAVERVRERARTARPDEWIIGWGWDEGAWAAHYPTHHGLSEAAPNNPVVLTGLHGFATWVNRRALEMAGITREMKDPQNGKVLRDPETGEPTGVLTDRAQSLVARHIPVLTPERRKQALEMAARECARYGLTSLHEARVSAADLTAYRELLREDRLPLRVYVMLDGADRTLVEEWLRKGPEVDRERHRLTVRAVKVFADGALGSRGAALFEPYSDKPDTKGVITTPGGQLYELTRRSLERGFQVSTHAIGDAANHMALDAYERALKDAGGKGDARLRIEHAQVLAPEDIPRFARIGVIPSMQPSHCTSDMAWAEQRVGPVRVRGAYAWRSLLKTGVHLPLSSDFPGETLNPLAGMHAAVTRQDAEGNPPGGWHPDERLTAAEALRGYTVEAAYSGFQENDQGSIETGKLADLTVISGDPLKLPARQWLSLRVLMTMVGGKVVYDGR